MYAHKPSGAAMPRVAITITSLGCASGDRETGTATCTTRPPAMAIRGRINATWLPDDVAVTWRHRSACASTTCRSDA